MHYAKYNRCTYRASHIFTRATEYECLSLLWNLVFQHIILTSELIQYNSTKPKILGSHQPRSFCVAFTFPVSAWPPTVMQTCNNGLETQIANRCECVDNLFLSGVCKLWQPVQDGSCLLPIIVARIGSRLPTIMHRVKHGWIDGQPFKL